MTLDAALSRFPALASLAGKIGLLPALIAPTDAPTVSLPADELAAYAGRYASPAAVTTVAVKGEGLELSVELLNQPGAWQSTIQPPRRHRRR